MHQHDLAAGQFGSTAANYLASAVHAGGADLARLCEWVAERQPATVLDLGCGAGHASFAMARANAKEIVAYDLAPQMLEVVAAEARARQHPQIQTRLGPAEHLPFPDAWFDLVVTRYSAHHWTQVPQALVEVARVLKPGATFVIIDVTAPETALWDTVLQTLELLRDKSHARNYRVSEWHAMLAAAKFMVPTIDRWRLPMEFTSWVARIGTTAPRIAALRTVMDALSVEARDYFAVQSDYSFTIDSCWIEAAKR